ncbi:NAD(P)-dependent oxidoreductase [Kocuria sp.]|uniref:NAD(P)-dependent oxidoreductase n=1 Tax=Kocuria sp. TaxID=1871328 RepID=UPI0026DD0D95|nr:NAD(P)H-binding protein [Kocuria sp.]MDO4918808.1 NAD(P)H-binding protein [Kocuria sp.]
MKIGIVGATGRAGSGITREALRRGHEVVALVRDSAKAREMFGESVSVLERDALALTAADLDALDAVVDAFATPPQHVSQHLVLAENLLRFAASGSPRLLFILGAGSLTAGDDHHLYVEDIRATPGAEHWIAIPETQLRQLDLLRASEGPDWVGVSPQAVFEPGPATTPVLGADEIMLGADGESHTTTGTMAVAVLDELEDPRHHRTRFTVGDA